MQTNEHVVFFRQTMRRLREDNRSKHLVLHRQTTRELSRPGGKLNDAIRFLIRERLERGIDRHNRRAIDTWISIFALLGGIEHGRVLGGRGDRHYGNFCVRRDKSHNERRCGPSATVGSWRGCTSYHARRVASSIPRRILPASRVASRSSPANRGHLSKAIWEVALIAAYSRRGSGGGGG